MNHHPDCAHLCQLKAHKGLYTCLLSGECHLAPLPFDRLDDNMEKENEREIRS
jgi:hypothetical protein